jgi:hypothetical protein
MGYLSKFDPAYMPEVYRYQQRNQHKTMDKSNIITLNTHMLQYNWTGPVRMEGSWGATKPVTVPCSLTLHLDVHNRPTFLELEAGEEYAEIGLELDDQDTVTGYDGVMSFPPQAVEMLEALGYTVDADLKD